MELSVIDNDPKEVKKYLQNFVPINYYRVLDDAYLYQVRAILNQAVSHSDLVNPKYDNSINDLLVQVGNNKAAITDSNRAWANAYQAGVERTSALEVQVADTQASIIEIDKAIVTQNTALVEARKTLQASIDNIQVGGRNLIPNSDFKKGYATWYKSEIEEIYSPIGTMHKITNIGTESSSYGIHPLTSYKKIRLIEGNEYTLSFYGYGTILLLNEIYITSAGNPSIKLPNIVMSGNITDIRKVTFISPVTSDSLGFVIGASGDSKNSWFTIVNLKLEIGNQATAWTQAPEDVDDYIGQIGAVIDDFKEIQLTTNSAQALAIEKLRTVVGTNSADIEEERLLRTNEYSSLAQRTDSLESTVGSNSSNITRIDNVYNDFYSSQASINESLTSQTNASKGEITNIKSLVSDNRGTIGTVNDSLNAKIEGVKVGGRNLLKNADYRNGYLVWGTSSIIQAESNLGYLTRADNTGTSNDYFGFESLNKYKNIHLIKDREYVLSFYAQATFGILNDIWISSAGNEPIELSDVAVTSSIRDRYEIVFTAPYHTKTGNLIIGASGVPTGSWFSVVCVKLEEGNKATAWTLAPEDTGEIIGAVEANIEEFKRVQVAENLAIAERSSLLETKTDNTIGEISRLDKAISTNKQSIISTENKLRAEFNNITGGNESTLGEAITANSAAIENNTVLIANESTARATDISNLSSEFTLKDNNTNELVKANKSEILVNKETINTTNQSIANLETKLRAEYKSADTTINNKVINNTSSISSLSSSISDINQSLTTQSTTLRSEYKAADKILANNIVNNKTIINETNIALSNEVMARGEQANKIRTEFAAGDAALNRAITSSNANILSNKNAISSATTAIGQVDNKIEVAVNNIKVGSVNLIENSDFKPLNTWTEYGNSELFQAYDNTLGTVTRINNKVDNEVFGITNSSGYRKIQIIEGRTYTLSFTGQGTMSELNYCYLMRSSGSNTHLGNIKLGSGSLNKHSITFTANWSANDAFILIATRYVPKGAWFAFTGGIKLEEGNIATDWSPSPLDGVKALASTNALVNSNKSAIATLEGSLARTESSLRAEFVSEATIQDTRNDDQPPEWYYSNYPHKTAKEFKRRSVLNIDGSGSYVYLETTVKWSEPTGGAIIQTAITDDNRVYIRTSKNTTTWNKFEEQESTLGSQRKVNELKQDLEPRINTAIAEITNFKQAQSTENSATAVSLEKLETTLAVSRAIYAYDMGATISEWINYSGNGEIRRGSDGKLLIGNNSGNDQAWLIHNKNILVQKGVLYKITCVSNNYYEGNTIFIGVAGVASNGFSFVNNAGINTYNSQHYVSSFSDKGRRTTVGYVSTSAEVLVGLPNSRVLHNDVKYIRPLVIANYPGKTGQAYFEYFNIEVADTTNTASVISQQESIDGIKASNMIELNVNGKISGLYQESTGKRSSFNILSDSFSISDGRTDVAPFILSNRQLKLNADLISNMSIQAPTIIGGLIKGTTVQAGKFLGGSININNNFIVDSSGNLTAKSGRFEGTILADQISGYIDIETMKRSTWTPSYAVYYVNNDSARTPEEFSSVREFSGSHVTYGSINVSYSSSDSGRRLYAAMFEITVDVSRTTEVRQLVETVDNAVYVYVNGSRVALSSLSGRVISYTLPKGRVLIQVILRNSGGEGGLTLLGDFIDNKYVKFT